MISYAGGARTGDYDIKNPTQIIHSCHISPLLFQQKDLEILKNKGLKVAIKK